MRFGTAALLLLLAVLGIPLVNRCLCHRPALQKFCKTLLVLLALACAGYLALTLLFVDAVRNQPPAP